MDGQVIAPFLIILRVANRSAVTGDSVVSGGASSMDFRSQGRTTTSGSGTLLDEYPMSSMEIHGKTSDELDFGDNKTINEVPR